MAINAVKKLREELKSGGFVVAAAGSAGTAYYASTAGNAGSAGTAANAGSASTAGKAGT